MSLQNQQKMKLTIIEHYIFWLENVMFCLYIIIELWF